MYNIAIIGAGQLGSRHLQGLAKIDIPVIIEVVDQSQEQLDLSYKRFNEIPRNTNVHGIKFVKSINDIASDIDLCIISTASDIRSLVTLDLVNNKNVENIIFEKVLFQSLSDYDIIQNLLNSKNIKAWVNCSRRLNPVYKEIKTLFKPGEKLIYRVSGGLWGMACNAIHFIDQMFFLNGEIHYKIDTSHLDQEILESKRKGFIEFSGTVRMIFDNGSELILDSKPEITGQDIILISGNNYHVLVVEVLGKAFIAHIDDSVEWREKSFRVPYQSELTHLVARDILLSSHCELVSFSDSSSMHKTMLEGFIKHLEASTGRRVTNCPIT